jgi:hypothetical protein
MILTLCRRAKVMSLFTLSLVIALNFCAGNADAGEVREIELTDGSVISGEVLSLSSGIYTVRSGSLGIVKLEESKVRTIRSKTPSLDPQPAQSSSSPGQIQSLEQKMISDKEIMGLIQSLQDDPEFKNMLEDPDVMKAVNAGDIAALSANPKFMKLLNNRTVQEIEKKMK